MVGVDGGSTVCRTEPDSNLESCALAKKITFVEIREIWFCVKVNKHFVYAVTVNYVESSMASKIIDINIITKCQII